MATAWLVMWAFALSLAWLLPNHYRPWSSFHLDAWFVLMALSGAAASIVRVRTAVRWSTMACMLAFLVLLPWFQFGVGLLPFGGQAWMSSSYLLGFLLAILVGTRWEMAAPRQLPNALLLAISLAALVSVCLQLVTWLGVWDEGATELWSMGLNGERPYANLGQPNLLATLILWGLLACLWFYGTNKLSALSAISLSAFLLLGLALTRSRMATLAATVVLLGVWFWRRHWPSAKTPWAVTGLYLFFWACPFLFKWLDSVLLFAHDGNYLRLQEQGDLRLGAWRLFWQAIVERPWLGYGWTDLSAAQIAVADRMPGIGGLFAHSHNLFLDFAVWNGLPLGLLMAGLLICWFWLRFRAVQHAEDATLFIFLCVVAVHAMVEFPLHYAYFLLPAGLVMGVLEFRLHARVAWTTPRWTLAVLWLAAAVAFGVTVRDYFRVEASYRVLQFEQARIGLGKDPLGEPPDVLVLTQLRELIRFARFNAHAEMSGEELEWMKDVASAYPTAAAIYQVAGAFALNGRPDDARLWLSKICKIADREGCRLTQRAWEKESLTEPRKAAIPWPSR